MSGDRSRQGFLGRTSETVLERLHVALIGLGGGGSHIAQQLAYVGVGNFTLIDHDRIDASNLNRLVGGTAADVRRKARKTAIAARVIRAVNPEAHVRQLRDRWQLKATAIRTCDVVVGCIDTYQGRRELEAFCRRFLIPYIDLGMDVFEVGGRYAIAGQVTLSMPGYPCTKCMGVIRDEWLAEEAAAYGAAGGKPQVVWPNGLLASAAVGTLMQVVTPWHNNHRPSLLLEYDGNAQELVNGAILNRIPSSCPHFEGIDNLGDPFFRLG
jgi:molybdopterin-synthase adenylyltransferase